MLDGPQLLLNVAHVNLSCFIQRLYAERVYELRQIGHYVFSAYTAYTKLAISIYSRFLPSSIPSRPTKPETRRGRRKKFQTPLDGNSNILEIKPAFYNRFVLSIHVFVDVLEFKRRKQRMVRKKERKREASCCRFGQPLSEEHSSNYVSSFRGG